jgi:hypothetical protein
VILGLADTVEGLNRGYVVIMAFTEAIPIAMLVPLQLIWLGVTTGTVLVPGCGGLDGGGGGGSVRPDGRWCPMSWEILRLNVKIS